MRIAIGVFEGAEELDFVGPWEVLAAWRFLQPDEVDVFLVADTLQPITCAKGMRVLADRTWDDAGQIDTGDRNSEHGSCSRMALRCSSAMSTRCQPAGASGRKIEALDHP